MLNISASILLMFFTEKVKAIFATCASFKKVCDQMFPVLQISHTWCHKGCRLPSRVSDHTPGQMFVTHFETIMRLSSSKHVEVTVSNLSWNLKPSVFAGGCKYTRGFLDI